MNESKNKNPNPKKPSIQQEASKQEDTILIYEESEESEESGDEQGYEESGNEQLIVNQQSPLSTAPLGKQNKRDFVAPPIEKLNPLDGEEGTSSPPSEKLKEFKLGQKSVESTKQHILNICKGKELVRDFELKPKDSKFLEEKLNISCVQLSESFDLWRQTLTTVVKPEGKTESKNVNGKEALANLKKKPINTVRLSEIADVLKQVQIEQTGEARKHFVALHERIQILTEFGKPETWSDIKDTIRREADREKYENSILQVRLQKIEDLFRANPLLGYLPEHLLLLAEFIKTQEEWLEVAKYEFEQKKEREEKLEQYSGWFEDLFMRDNTAEKKKKATQIAKENREIETLLSTLTLNCYRNGSLVKAAMMVQILNAFEEAKGGPKLKNSDLLWRLLDLFNEVFNNIPWCAEQNKDEQSNGWLSWIWKRKPVTGKSEENNAKQKNDVPKLADKRSDRVRRYLSKEPMDRLKPFTLAKMLKYIQKPLLNLNNVKYTKEGSKSNRYQDEKNIENYLKHVAQMGTNGHSIINLSVQYGGIFVPEEKHESYQFAKYIKAPRGFPYFDLARRFRIDFFGKGKGFLELRSLLEIINKAYRNYGQYKNTNKILEPYNARGNVQVFESLEEAEKLIQELKTRLGKNHFFMNWFSKYNEDFIRNMERFLAEQEAFLKSQKTRIAKEVLARSKITFAHVLKEGDESCALDAKSIHNYRKFLESAGGTHLQDFNERLHFDKMFFKELLDCKCAVEEEAQKEYDYGFQISVRNGPFFHKKETEQVNSKKIKAGQINSKKVAGLICLVKKNYTGKFDEKDLKTLDKLKRVLLDDDYDAISQQDEKKDAISKQDKKQREFITFQEDLQALLNKVDVKYEKPPNDAKGFLKHIALTFTAFAGSAKTHRVYPEGALDFLACYNKKLYRQKNRHAQLAHSWIERYLAGTLEPEDLKKLERKIKKDIDKLPEGLRKEKLIARLKELSQEDIPSFILKKYGLTRIFQRYRKSLILGMNATYFTKMPGKIKYIGKDQSLGHHILSGMIKGAEWGLYRTLDNKQKKYVVTKDGYANQFDDEFKRIVGRAKVNKDQSLIGELEQLWELGQLSSNEEREERRLRTTNLSEALVENYTKNEKTEKAATRRNDGMFNDLRIDGMINNLKERLKTVKNDEHSESYQLMAALLVVKERIEGLSPLLQEDPREFYTMNEIEKHDNRFKRFKEFLNIVGKGGDYASCPFPEIQEQGAKYSIHFLRFAINNPDYAPLFLNDSLFKCSQQDFVVPKSIVLFEGQLTQLHDWIMHKNITESKDIIENPILLELVLQILDKAAGETAKEAEQLLLLLLARIANYVSSHAQTNEQWLDKKSSKNESDKDSLFGLLDTNKERISFQQYQTLLFKVASAIRKKPSYRNSVETLQNLGEKNISPSEPFKSNVLASQTKLRQSLLTFVKASTKEEPNVLDQIALHYLLYVEDKEVRRESRFQLCYDLLNLPFNTTFLSHYLHGKRLEFLRNIHDDAEKAKQFTETQQYKLVNLVKQPNLLFSGQFANDGFCQVKNNGIDLITTVNIDLDKLRFVADGIDRYGLRRKNEPESFIPEEVKVQALCTTLGVLIKNGLKYQLNPTAREVLKKLHGQVSPNHLRSLRSRGVENFPGTTAAALERDEFTTEKQAEDLIKLLKKNPDLIANPHIFSLVYEFCPPRVKRFAVLLLVERLLINGFEVDEQREGVSEEWEVQPGQKFIYSPDEFDELIDFISTTAQYNRFEKKDVPTNPLEILNEECPPTARIFSLLREKRKGSSKNIYDGSNTNMLDVVEALTTPKKPGTEDDFIISTTLSEVDPRNEVNANIEQSNNKNRIPILRQAVLLKIVERGLKRRAKKVKLKNAKETVILRYEGAIQNLIEDPLRKKISKYKREQFIELYQQELEKMINICIIGGVRFENGTFIINSGLGTKNNQGCYSSETLDGQEHANIGELIRRLIAFENSVLDNTFLNTEQKDTLAIAKKKGLASKSETTTIEEELRSAIGAPKLLVPFRSKETFDQYYQMFDVTHIKVTTTETNEQVIHGANIPVSYPRDNFLRTLRSQIKFYIDEKEYTAAYHMVANLQLNLAEKGSYFEELPETEQPKDESNKQNTNLVKKMEQLTWNAHPIEEKFYAYLFKFIKEHSSRALVGQCKKPKELLSLIQLCQLLDKKALVNNSTESSLEQKLASALLETNTHLFQQLAYLVEKTHRRYKAPKHVSYPEAPSGAVGKEEVQNYERSLQVFQDYIKRLRRWQKEQQELKDFTQFQSMVSQILDSKINNLLNNIFDQTNVVEAKQKLKALCTDLENNKKLGAFYRGINDYGKKNNKVADVLELCGELELSGYVTNAEPLFQRLPKTKFDKKSIIIRQLFNQFWFDINFKGENTKKCLVAIIANLINQAKEEEKNKLLEDIAKIVGVYYKVGITDSEETSSSVSTTDKSLYRDLAKRFLKELFGKLQKGEDIECLMVKSMNIVSPQTQQNIDLDDERKEIFIEEVLLANERSAVSAEKLLKQLSGILGSIESSRFVKNIEKAFQAYHLPQLILSEDVELKTVLNETEKFFPISDSHSYETKKAKSGGVVEAKNCLHRIKIVASYINTKLLHEIHETGSNKQSNISNELIQACHFLETAYKALVKFVKVVKVADNFSETDKIRLNRSISQLRKILNNSKLSESIRLEAKVILNQFLGFNVKDLGTIKLKLLRLTIDKICADASDANILNLICKFNQLYTETKLDRGHLANYLRGKNTSNKLSLIAEKRLNAWISVVDTKNNKASNLFKKHAKDFGNIINYWDSPDNVREFIKKQLTGERKENQSFLQERRLYFGKNEISKAARDDIAVLTKAFFGIAFYGSSKEIEEAIEKIENYIIGHVSQMVLKGHSPTGYKVFCEVIKTLCGVKSLNQINKYVSDWMQKKEELSLNLYKIQSSLQKKSCSHKQKNDLIQEIKRLGDEFAKAFTIKAIKKELRNIGFPNLEISPVDSKEEVIKESPKNKESSSKVIISPKAENPIRNSKRIGIPPQKRIISNNSSSEEDLLGSNPDSYFSGKRLFIDRMSDGSKSAPHGKKKKSSTVQRRSKTLSNINSHFTFKKKSINESTSTNPNSELLTSKKKWTNTTT